MAKKKGSVSLDRYEALEERLVGYAYDLKALIEENRRLLAENVNLQGKLDARVHDEAAGMRNQALLDAIKGVKLPDHKTELAVLLRGNDLILSLLKEILNERRMGT